jgi:hypothetical protein
MKTRIAKSSGLALTLIVGIFATLLALGVLDANTVWAGPDDDTALTVAADPNDPGAIAKWTVTFNNPVTLAANTGEIIIEFEDDVQVPTVIDPKDVTITADRFSNLPTSGSPATGTVVANPLGVNVRLVSQFSGTVEGTGVKNEPEVTLSIGDMEPSTATTGSQGILGPLLSGTDNLVTVVFRQSAGIKNPTESKPGFDSNGDSLAYDVRVGVTGSLARVVTSGGDYAETQQSAKIPRKVITSSADGTRGKRITITGKGFQNGVTATIWRDVDGDGTRDSGEIDLANALVGGDDTFTASVTIGNPPFATGSSTNLINAIDGQKNTLNSVSSDFTIPKFDLRGSVVATPSTASVGDTVQLDLKDFAQGTFTKTTDSAAAQGSTGAGQPYIVLGGVVVDTPAGSTNASGESTFNVTVPNGVPAGTLELRIMDDDTAAAKTHPSGQVNFTNSTRTTKMVVSPAVLNLTPETDLVPNQTITVIGQGYTTGGAAEINDSTDSSSVLIDGDSTGLKASGTASATSKINEGTKITIDNGGNWSSAVVLPINTTTVTPGSHTLKVTDDQGREGLATLIMRERNLGMTPLESRVGTVVSITGSGFPADNTKTGAASTPSVSIKYTYGTTTDTVATLTPDASGNINGTFTVPLNAPIPSTNSVTAEFKYTPTGGSETTATTAVTHEIPRATVTISPSSGPTGTEVTITGEGFKTFSTVSTLDIGDIDVRPAPIPSTDAEGGFTTKVLIPQANTGSQSVQAKVSSTVAATTYTVTKITPTATPAPVAASQAPADALAALISNNDNLQRVWHFDPSAQSVAPDYGWFLYDPRPVFAAANSVDEIAGGKFYWINVREAQTAILGGESRSLFAGWNPVTW